MESMNLDIQSFEHPDLAELLEAAPRHTLDAAPFGIISLDRQGRVDFYNQYEQELAGLSADDVMGRDFFVEVAPCTNNFMVRERFMNAWQQRQELDELLPYTFSYRMKATPVRLRMLVRGERGWLLVNKHA